MSLKKVWKWLDGKKTIIAGAFWGITIPIQSVITIPEPLAGIITTVGLLLTYVGLGHKVEKKYVSGGSDPTLTK